LEKRMTDLHLVPPPTPGIPDDPFLAALEARILLLIAEVVEDHGPAATSAAAYHLAQARDLYLDCRAELVEPISDVYVDRLHDFLRSLPAARLTRLRHPASRSRIAMQSALEGRHA
jgi:hypothetical protein